MVDLGVFTKGSKVHSKTAKMYTKGATLVKKVMKSKVAAMKCAAISWLKLCR